MNNLYPTAVFLRFYVAKSSNIVQSQGLCLHPVPFYPLSNKVPWLGSIRFSRSYKNVSDITKKKIIDFKSSKENCNIKMSKCLFKSTKQCLKLKKYFIGLWLVRVSS